MKNFKIILIHMLIGAAIFYFLVHPFTMVLYRVEFSNTPYTFSLLLDILKGHLLESFSLDMLNMSVSYIIFGGVLGLAFSLFWMNLKKKNDVINQQEKQLERNIEFIINSGEGEKIEFKSSLRYDYVNSKINKELEKVFLKTIAGFLNAKGGTLLMGVDDKGTVLGLENDYATLRKKDRDGFELKLMQLIATQIGTELCALIRISFYRLDEKDICSVDVSQSSIPAYVNLNNKTIFYLRIGNSTKQLTVQETVNYLNFNK